MMRYYFVLKCLAACKYNADVFTPHDSRQKTKNRALLHSKGELH